MADFSGTKAYFGPDIANVTIANSGAINGSARPTTTAVNYLLYGTIPVKVVLAITPGALTGSLSSSTRTISAPVTLTVRSVTIGGVPQSLAALPTATSTVVLTGGAKAVALNAKASFTFSNTGSAAPVVNGLTKNVALTVWIISSIKK